MQTRLFRTSVAAAFLASFALAGSAMAQGRIVIASQADGGVTTAANAGIAKVLSDNTNYAVQVRNYASPEAFLPDLNDGTVDLSSHFSATAWLVYNKIASNLELKDLRLLRSAAAAAPLGFMVRADSGIESVADLKGKRVAGEYGAHPIMQRLAGGILKAYGVSWDDVDMVPVAVAAEGGEALVDGRVDGAWYSVFTPQTQEAHSKVGVKFLPVELDDAQLAQARKDIFPGIVRLQLPEKTPPWAASNLPVISYEYYVMVSSKTPDDVVQAIAEALWENSDAVREAHPVLRGFSNEAAVSLQPVLPYHPAAIEFYKGKGVWSEEADAANMAVDGAS